MRLPLSWHMQHIRDKVFHHKQSFQTGLLEFTGDQENLFPSTSPMYWTQIPMLISCSQRVGKDSWRATCGVLKKNSCTYWFQTLLVWWVSLLSGHSLLVLVSRDQVTQTILVLIEQLPCAVMSALQEWNSWSGGEWMSWSKQFCWRSKIAVKMQVISYTDCTVLAQGDFAKNVSNFHWLLLAFSEPVESKDM